MTRVASGLEVIADDPPPFLKRCRLGLLCNPASVDHRLVHARHRLQQALPGQLQCRPARLDLRLRLFDQATRFGLGLYRRVQRPYGARVLPVGLVPGLRGEESG